MAFVVKIRFGDDIRRLSLREEEISLEGVQKLISILYSGIRQPFVIRYRDDENDVITVTTEREFAEAVRISQQSTSILNLFVEEPKEKTEPEDLLAQLGEIFLKQWQPESRGPCRRGPWGRGHCGRGPCGRGPCGKAPSGTSNSQEKPIHFAFCDGCTASGKPAERIAGTRYKCSACPDYDLCQACFEKEKANPGSIHDNKHNFLAIPFPQRRCGERSSFGCPFQVSAVHNAVCDGCSKEGKPEELIEGIRYKCTSCSDYDLCQTCFEKEKANPGSVHTAGHSDHFLSINHPFGAFNAPFARPDEKPEQPTQTKEEVKPQEVKPQEVKPQEVKPQEVKPQEVKPQEVKPQEVKPQEVKPQEVKPQEVKPQEPKPEEAKPDFIVKLNQLLEMGFSDKEKNIAILVRNKGNLVNTVRDLLAL